MSEKRVAITGLGAVTPIGNTAQELWENAVAGTSGAGPITRFDPTHFKTRFACEIKGLDLSQRLDRNEMRKADLYAQYGIYAATEALEDSGLNLDQLDPFDVGVIWGTGQGGLGTVEEEVKAYAANNFRPRFNPFLVPKMIVNMAAGWISMKHGLQGINYTTVSACATANSAIMDAFHYIRLGKATVIVTGSSDAGVTEASVGGFNAMRAMSTRNDDPHTASRPFDPARDGFVMGEGGGALILEDYDHARRRGAHIYAEVVGAAMTADAYHLSAAHPEGLGAAKAMELAMREAKLTTANVDYLNAHATSTPVGDLSELNAVRKVFGDAPANLSISGTKSMTGHLLGAAGAVEAILCVRSITDNVIPPTINTESIDPAIPAGMRIVTGEARQQNVKVAMSNAFGFGGHNAIAIFKGV